jgi:hypothetical protein
MNERDVRILAFEKRWWKLRGNKEQAIADEFGMTPIRYVQVLNQILDNSDSLQIDPILVNRLRRLRSRREEERRQR